MHNLLRIITVFLLFFLLASCVGAYHAWNGTTGYKETRTGPDQWLITYAEGSSPDITMAKYHAAMRCAELAEENGKTDYKFTVTKEGSKRESAAIGSSYIVGLNGAMSVSEDTARDQKHTTSVYQKEYLIPVVKGICDLNGQDQTSPQTPDQTPR